MKKEYIAPKMAEELVTLENIATVTVSVNGEGLGSGGRDEEGLDPSAKHRDEGLYDDKNGWKDGLW